MTESQPAVRVRAEILALAGYKQGTAAPLGAFKLSSNENPFEPLPGVLEAMASATELNRYPGAGTVPLREALAARFGRTPGEVHIGAGSVSIIAQLIAVSSAPGDEVLYSWRSFEAYPLLTAIAGATAVGVPNRPDHAHDLPAMAAAVTERTRLILICSPNNPTGTTVSQQEVEEFLAAVPSDVLVVLDEAYIEFATAEGVADGTTLLAAHPNLVVLRTFSKAWGLAGLRIGYALGEERILDLLRTVTMPLSVTESAQAAALASLEAEAELMRRVAVVAERRDRLRAALLAQGWAVPEAQGNFVWLPVLTASSAVAEAFRAGGVVVRPYGDDGVRITVGEEESVDRVLSISADLVTNPPTGALFAGLR